MTKKLCLFIVLFIVLLATSLQAGSVRSKTFFQSRSLSLNSVIEHALDMYRINHAAYSIKHDKKRGHKSAFHLQASIVHQLSNDCCKQARYFLPCSKKNEEQVCAENCAAAQECASKCLKSCAPEQLIIDQQGNGDIGSGWLSLTEGGVDENFRGKFTIAPRRKVIGVGILYHHDLSDCINGLWIRMWMPVVHVEHQMNIQETIQSNNINPESFKSISAALNNPDWNYGKWSSTPRSKSGIDDVMFKFGYHFIDTDRIKFDSYGVAIIPFGQGSTAEFVFEPTIGSGGHVALGIGTAIDLIAHINKQHTCNFFVDAQYRYFFPGIQKRSFDLKERPFSRYLIFNEDGKNPATFGKFGINLLTQDLTIYPGSQFDLVSAVGYHIKQYNAEFGYNFWIHGGHHATLRDRFAHTKVAITTQELDAFFPDAKISDAWASQAVPHREFIPIAQRDLDLSSADHRHGCGHTFFGAISYNDHVSSSPIMIGFGTSYQLSMHNTALNVLSVWARVGIGF